jgi:outer membrane protein
VKRFVLFSLLLPLFSEAATLSWRDCVRTAIENNAELKANRALAESVREQEGVAFSGFLPTFNYTVGYGQFTPSTYDPNQSQTAITNNWNGTFKLNQNVFNGFVDQEKYRSALASTRAQRSALQITKAQISLNLKTAYQNYLYSKSYQKMIEDIIHRRQENLRIVELRFQSGRENKGSVLLVRAYYNQAKLDDLQALDLRDVAKTQLRRALNLEDNEDIDVKDEIPVQNWKTYNAPVPDFSRIAENTPAHTQAYLLAEARNHDLEVARGTFYPNLNFTGEYGTVSGLFYPHIQHWIYGINLTFPLFNGGKDYSTYKAASYTKLQSDYQKANVDQITLVNLRTNYTALLEAVEKLKVDESFKEAALIRAEIARKKYNNGLLSFDEWDIIENDRIYRERNYLQSVRDRVVAEATWENAQGVGVIQ